MSKRYMTLNLKSQPAEESQTDVEHKLSHCYNCSVLQTSGTLLSDTTDSQIKVKGFWTLQCFKSFRVKLCISAVLEYATTYPIRHLTEQVWIVLLYCGMWCRWWYCSKHSFKRTASSFSGHYGGDLPMWVCLSFVFMHGYEITLCFLLAVLFFLLCFKANKWH